MPKKKPDFYESEIAPVLQSFLTLINFPRFGIRIRQLSQAEERHKGVDAELSANVRGFRPFYMQFKRPSSWQSTDNAKLVEQRKSLGLAISPESLFFELRDKTADQHDYQHNILFHLRTKLRSRELGDATYVCPLFMKFDRYVQHMHLAAIRKWIRLDSSPWIESELSVIDPTTGQIDFNLIPVFVGHVSIPPHVLVDSARHSYSFRTDGKQVCFHSPEKITESAGLLSDWLNNLYDYIYYRQDFVNPENSGEVLNDLLSVLALSLPSSEKDGLSWLSPWLQFGGLLREVYDIQQFGIIQLTEEAQARLRLPR